jgi:exopolyphosphatase/guanosine-5'-triphosphate,3'-diphosphate pyrophosphatase
MALDADLQQGVDPPHRIGPAWDPRPPHLPRRSPRLGRAMLRLLHPGRDDQRDRENEPVTRVAVIDVGANTVRLLVAELHAGVASPLEEDKEQLSLGADVEDDGRISKSLLAEAEETVERFAARARALRSVQLAVLVTSPGRQAENGDALIAALSRGAGTPARVVAAEEEGALAFRGATSGLDAVDGDTLVCDVGGGSAQVVVGADADGIAWWRSLDVGSLRLTNRFGLDGDVSDETLARARDEVARLAADLAPPAAERALATGGTARALHKLVGRTLGPEQLAEGIRIARARKTKDIAADYGLSRRRADRLLGGTLILEAVQARIELPFEVAAGGIREGAVLTLLARELAA